MSFDIPPDSSTAGAGVAAKVSVCSAASSSSQFNADSGDIPVPLDWMAANGEYSIESSWVGSGGSSSVPPVTSSSRLAPWRAARLSSQAIGSTPPSGSTALVPRPSSSAASEADIAAGSSSISIGSSVLSTGKSEVAKSSSNSPLCCAARFSSHVSGSTPPNGSSTAATGSGSAAGGGGGAAFADSAGRLPPLNGS